MNKKPAVSIFMKLAIAFLLVGLVPFLAISVFFLEELSKNVNRVILSDAELVLRSVSSSVDMMLEEWEECTGQLYIKNIESNLYLNDVLLDVSISERQKRLYIRRFLMNLETVNGLKSVRFLDMQGNLYYSSETVGKVVNPEEMEKWKEKELAVRRTEHEILLEAVHKDIYFSNMNDQVITVKRNLFDTTSLKTSEHCLGTIYLDIGEDAIVRQLRGIDLGGRSGFYMIDQTGAEMYRDEGQTSIPGKTRILLASTENGLMEDAQYYYLCRKNVCGGWISVLRVHRGDIQENIENTKRYILLTLAVSMLILLFLYLLFSKKFSEPIYKLKEGMEQIQEGRLDTRVQVGSRDEVGVLAEGLNQMAQQPSLYIDRVYGAELKQREAELNALKSQIRPHYLYNTLDIIRMTAVGNGDRQAAEMIESLGRQLRYLMGKESDTEPLSREIENIQDYFMIIRIRYENRMELKASVPESLRNVRVLKLILQPVAENAVKHGLKPKEGKGTVWVSAAVTGHAMEIKVIDDGVGMDEATLEQLKQKLASGRPNKPAREGGIGLCNVQERIRNKYGPEYGIEVESTLGVGTIVILRLPASGKGETDEISDAFD